MKKRKTAIIAIVALALICAVLIVLLIKPPFLSWATVRLYLGDRTKINFHVASDGKPTSMTRSENGEYRLSGSPGSYTFSARTNDYAIYEYELMIDPGDGNMIPLSISYQHFNWWEIMEGEVYIDFNTENKNYSIKQEYKYTADEPDYHYETITKPEMTLAVTGSIHLNLDCRKKRPETVSFFGCVLTPFTPVLLFAQRALSVFSSKCKHKRTG